MASINVKIKFNKIETGTDATVIGAVPSIYENAYNKVKAFVQNDITSHGAWDGAYSIQVHVDRSYRVYKGACHAGMVRSKSKLLCLGGGFQYKASSPVGPRFWDFLCDQNKSPWRVITSGEIELITAANGNGLGWIIKDQNILSKVPFAFLKNFCITTRMISEYTGRIELWYDLVSKHGVDERDAFYICSMFYKFNGKILQSEVRTGSHWPLTDVVNNNYYSTGSNNIGYQLDWNKFKSGKINDTPVGARINGYWCSKQSENPKYKSFNPSTVSMTQTVTKFTSSAEYKIESIIDEFYNWKQKQGII